MEGEGRNFLKKTNSKEDSKMPIVVNSNTTATTASFNLSRANDAYVKVSPVFLRATES